MTACGDACEGNLGENRQALRQGFRVWCSICDACGFRYHLQTAQRNGFSVTHQITIIFMMSLAQRGKIVPNRQFTDICRTTLKRYTHVFECMVTVVSGLFVEICLLCTLSNMIAL